MLMSDGNSAKSSGETDIVTGDMIAALSCVSFAINLVLYDVIIKKCNVFAVIAVISLFTVVNFAAFQVISDGFSWDYLSMDPVTGWFGCYASENIWITLGLVGPFSQMLGNSGYAFGLMIAPPEIMGTLFLLEPFSGQIMSVLFGLDEIPGIFTALGTIVITMGIYVTAKGSTKREMEEQCETQLEGLELSNGSFLVDDEECPK